MANLTMKLSFNDEQMEELKNYIKECIDNLREELEEKYAIK